ncbi:MAG: phage terminase large subunit family protein [Methylocella sp.]
MTPDLDEAAQLHRYFPGLADGRRVLFEALAKAALREGELSVSEWCDKFRRVSPESGSPFPGEWRTSRVPYVREPLDCLHPDHPARRLALKWSAQTAKNEIGVCWFAYIVDQCPGPTLTVLPTGGEAMKYNRLKIQPTIDASPRIKHKVMSVSSRDEAGSTTSFKKFAGGFNQIVTASSSKGLQMLSIRWLILDEVSGYLRDVDGRGSPSSQARARQNAFGSLAKELAISTPDMQGECEISELFEAGHQRRCYLPCPHCGVYQVLRYENMMEPTAGTGWRPTFSCGSSGHAGHARPPSLGANPHRGRRAAHSGVDRTGGHRSPGRAALHRTSQALGTVLGDPERLFPVRELARYLATRSPGAWRSAAREGLLPAIPRRNV